MDKIKTVKIKNPDGSISEETYTISVDAHNVDMVNGKDVQDTIGTIDIDKDGNIAEQLSFLKQNELHKTDIIDNLNSENAEKMLSANQGRVLNNKIITLEDNMEITYATKEELNEETNLRTSAETLLQTALDLETTNRTNEDSLLRSQISSLASGAPIPVGSTSEMTDTSKVYVNTTNGYWYYYNGTAWTAGGIYQASVVSEEDPVIEDINSQLSTIYETVQSINYLNPYTTTVGAITADGSITTYQSWANYKTSDYIKVKAGDIFKGYAIPNYNMRWVCCFFDRYKNPIGGFYNQDSLRIHTLIVQQDGYIRCSLNGNVFDESGMLTKGETVSPTYVAYEQNQYILLPRIDGEIKESELDSDFLNNTVRYAESVDIDFSQSVSGYLYSNGGIGAHDDYKTTDFIKVSPNFRYTFLPRIRKFLFYDINKTPKYFKDFEPSSDYVYVTPSSGYIRFTYYKNEEENVYVTKERNQIEQRKLEDNSLLSNSMKQEVEEMMNSQSQYMHNILTGKKWWACGDSFTEWTTEEFNPNDYPNITDELTGHHYKTYPFWIGVRNNMNVHNFSKSGQTLATPASGTFTNAFSNNLYTQIPDDVDYITIQLGINDSHHRESAENPIPLGTITDTTVNTFYGAWNVVLPYLIEHHPFAHIGVLVSNGCDSDDYRIATINCCKKWGIPYIDLNGDDRTPFMLRSTNEEIEESVRLQRTSIQSADYPSNTHPNTSANLYESYFIENFLKSI